MKSDVTVGLFIVGSLIILIVNIIGYNGRGKKGPNMLFIYLFALKDDSQWLVFTYVG